MLLNCINISLLGQDDSQLQTLKKIIANTISSFNLNAHLEVINDDFIIKSLGIKSTPSIIINNNVEFEGSLPSSSELKNAFSKYTNINKPEKSSVSSHHKQISEFSSVLSDPLNVLILELIQNKKCCCNNLDIFESLNLPPDEVLQHLKELKCVGLISGTLTLPMKFCINKINWGVAKILFTNLFK